LLSSPVPNPDQPYCRHCGEVIPPGDRRPREYCSDAHPGAHATKTSAAVDADNAELDHGAFAHGMGLAGQPGMRTVGIARVPDAAVVGGYRPPGARKIDLSPIEPLVDESAVDPVVDESAVDPVVDESAAEPVVGESAVEPVAAAAPSDIVTNTRVDTLVATFPADGSIPPFLRRVPS
jgi:hypothetical protein